MTTAHRTSPPQANRSPLAGQNVPAAAPAAESEQRAEREPDHPDLTAWPGSLSGRPHIGPDTPAKGPHRPLHARPRARHSRWPAMALAFLVAAGLVVVGILDRQDILPAGRAPALTEADARSSAGAHTPTSAAVPVPSSATAPARAAVPVPVEPRGGEPIIQDSLATSGQWFYTGARGSGDKCSVANGMHVTVAGRGSFQCIGPSEYIEDDFGVQVAVILVSPGSCAAIWFHWRRSTGGHVLRACQSSVTVAADKPGGKEVFGRLPLSPPMTLGRATTIHAVVRNGRADVYRDGNFLGTVPLPAGEPTGGQVLLGSGGGESPGKAPYTVTLKDVDIRSL